MRETVIYVPELRRSFATIAAAARATGADASNVGKVLKGQRRTAGGMHFEMRWAREEGRGDALRALFEQIDRANEMLVTAKERKKFGFSKELQDLDRMRDDIGSTKKGFFTKSAKAFASWSVEDLQHDTQKLMQGIRTAEKALRKLDDEIRDLADMLGLSFREALQYEMIVPEFYRMLDLAGKDQRIGTNEMLETEILITNMGATEEQVQNLFDKLNRFFADPALPRSYFDEAVEATIVDISRTSRRLGAGTDAASSYYGEGPIY